MYIYICANKTGFFVDGTWQSIYIPYGSGSVMGMDRRWSKVTKSFPVIDGKYWIPTNSMVMTTFPSMTGDSGWLYIFSGGYASSPVSVDSKLCSLTWKERNGKPQECSGLISSLFYGLGKRLPPSSRIQCHPVTKSVTSNLFVAIFFVVSKILVPGSLTRLQH